MVNLVKIYDGELGPFRVTQLYDESLLFCAKDVCRILGFSNPSRAIRKYVSDIDHINIVGDYGMKRPDGKPVVGRINFLSLMGVLSLAKADWQRGTVLLNWLNSEVLPDLAKNAFMSPEERAKINPIPMAIYMERTVKRLRPLGCRPR